MKTSRMMIAGTAALAAWGIVPTAAQASPASAVTWTRQALAVHPPARTGSAMAYDAATGTVVLFGGDGTSLGSFLADTWTWNGTTWMKRHPAASPPAREDAAMAYDAATGTVVLFGGIGNGSDNLLRDTWTWNGTTWTKRHPAASPPAREDAAMAYDAATGTVVLFGGAGGPGNDTWTWNGTTWTKQLPAASPPARDDAAMAYDAATGTVVLFGGENGQYLADTWTWDGTTWTKRHPAASPPGRYGAAMAYDAATGTVVLFGGRGASSTHLADTWTWNGTTWTQQHPAASPPGRAFAAMAYDAATGTAVLFGGTGPSARYRSDTWTWG